ncbi:MAG: hypothetical protein WAK29_14765, partial [Terriglobales bacterium]
MHERHLITNWSSLALSVPKGKHLLPGRSAVPPSPRSGQQSIQPFDKTSQSGLNARTLTARLDFRRDQPDLVDARRMRNVN